LIDVKKYPNLENLDKNVDPNKVTRKFIFKINF